MQGAVAGVDPQLSSTESLVLASYRRHGEEGVVKGRWSWGMAISRGTIIEEFGSEVWMDIDRAGV